MSPINNSPSDVSLDVTQRSWSPLLVGEEKQRALAAIEDVVATLPAPSSLEVTNATLAGGAAGIAVLCAYLSRAGLDDDQNTAQFLTHATNAVSAQPMSASLYSGFTGIAWTVAHLQEPILDSAGDPNEAIDDALKSYLQKSPWNDHYDLVTGLVGIGVYALEGLPRASAAECLELVMDKLSETAEHSIYGVTWFTRPHLLPKWQRERCPDGYYNLGMAHGVPGVIAFLGRMCLAGVLLEKARPLLEGSIAWLLRHKLKSSEHASFSHWTSPGIPQADCRLGWCYGDLGVAAALLSAARGAKEPEWEGEALRVARRAAARPPETSGVKDAGLCHGAAGLAHIFNRLFQATGESIFHESARSWFEQTLAMRRAGEGIGGFSAYRIGSDGKACWEDAIGILGGATGVALTLLAAVTDIEPTWDRMLLVST